MLLNLARKPKYLLSQALKGTRVPHWRYELAVEYDETRRDPDVRRDPWIGPTFRALPYIDSELCPPLLQPYRRATRIWGFNERRRWELEARILTGQPPADIADVMQLPEAVVEAYEAVFFDVRDCLTKSDYIAAAVLYRGMEHHPCDVGTVWRRYAYWQGLEVLETLLDHFRRRGWEDYRPILEEEPLPDRSPLDTKLEWDLFGIFLPSLGIDSLKLARATRPWQAAQLEEELHRLPAQFPDLPDDLVAASERLLTRSMTRASQGRSMLQIRAS